MSPTPPITSAIAQHRQHTEEVLARLRTDDSLDDGEKGRRITQVIAAANARLVELVGRETVGAGRTSQGDRAPLARADRRGASPPARVGARDGG